MRVVLGGYGLKSENLPIFPAFALSVSCIVVASLVLFALLLFFVGCVGCVVGGSFSLRMIATKEGERRCWCSLSLFVGCGFVICS